MKRIITLCMLIAATATFASAKDAPEAAPIAWGLLSQNTGCIIFAEGHKHSGMFYGVGATIKTQGKLTVIETQNYQMDEKEILETQENMDTLMQRAQRDKLKLVKIQEKYSPALLDKARSLCTQAQ